MTVSAREGENQVGAFVSLAKSCDFIGEIGLDFSREGKSTKELQLNIFAQIIDAAKGRKFVTVHSRDAAAELLKILVRKNVGPLCFHYFTGGPSIAAAVVQAGHYLSFNSRMLKGRHKWLLDIFPRDRVLVESDSPFLTTSPISALKDAYELIAAFWEVSLSAATQTIADNFARCRTAS